MALPRLHTAAEVADALQVSETYVQRKCRRREWPHHRGPRGSLRFTPGDVAEIQELMAVPVQGEPTARISFAPRSRRGAA